MKLLLERGAVVDNLRKAAALGRMDVLLGMLRRTGALTAAAGEIASPFDKLDTLLADAVRRSPREIVNNAAGLCRGLGTARGNAGVAEPGRRSERDSGRIRFRRHAAALRRALQGRRDTVDWLLQHGADPTVRDAKINNLPEDWAAHDGHADLAEHLKQIRQRG